MEKPYIRKYTSFLNFKVWIVDGSYIRKQIEPEFTNFGQHYQFNFIPKDEFWIDKDYGGNDEEKYYIVHMLIEHKLASEGMSSNEASQIAGEIEKRARDKSNNLINELEKRMSCQEIAETARKRLLKTYSKRVKVWIVKGKVVRDKLFIDFTEGGHDKVYSFIPENEIWIDDSIGSRERKFILLHELHERNLMSKGLPYWIYDSEEEKPPVIKNGDGFPKDGKSAHAASTEIEYFYRHHPDKVYKKIKEEMEQLR